MNRVTNQIGLVLSRAAAREPRRLALCGAGINYTYAELDERTTRLAHGLLALGCASGGHIAVWAGTSTSYIEIYLAAAKAGLVVVPVNNMFKVEEALHVLSDSRSEVLLYDDSVVELVESVVSHADLRSVVAMGERLVADARSLRSLSESASAAPLDPPAEDSPWVIGYTSGTTGRPKGAVLSHRVVKNAMWSESLLLRLPLFATRVVTANMSFVASAIAGIFPMFFVCGTVYLEPQADVEKLVRMSGDVHAATIGLPGPWFEGFTELVERDPDLLNHVTSIIHGGSHANPVLAQRLAAIVGDRLILSWGLTENCGVPVAATSPGDWERSPEVFASVGRPIVDTAVRIVDDEGLDLPSDGSSVGELLVQSPTLFEGYFGAEEATSRSFTDGWFRTGDLGSIDHDGYIYMSDRRTDLIVSGGMNIYPLEIERVLLELPGVVEAVVIGLPHERWGKTPVAVLIGSGQHLSETEVINHCRARLASYKKPTRVLYVGALPRNAAGKVLRRKLVEQLS